MVDNRMRDNHGVSIQARDIHGSVTVYSDPDASAPGWVDTALPVHRSDVRELGTHNALPGPGGEGLPPYVARDVDGELDRRLVAVAEAPRGGLVLVTGPSAAGKTRALAQALRRTMPDRMLVAPPEEADLRSLPTWLRERAERAPQGWVVWLDDLERHLSASGPTPALIAELGRVGAVVAATIRWNRLEALRPTSVDHTSAAEGVGYAVLKTPPIVVERRWNPQERERARAGGDERLVRAADDERFGVAEQLAVAPLLKMTWLGGPDNGHPRGHALVAAAVGLAEAGVTGSLTREQIQDLHTVYLSDPPPLPEEIDRAWEWATRPRGGLAGLLVPADHHGRWRAFDYLATEDALPEAVWRAALKVATEQDLFTVGLTAYRAGLDDIAEAAWTSPAEQGDTDSMFHLAFLLKETGRARKAKSWYRKAADLGHIDAMLALGLLLKREGRVRKAEAWYRRAAAQDDARAMALFGMLLGETGRAEESEVWFRRAADRGDTGSMVVLGILASKRGRKGDAEGWFRRAVDQGDPAGMFDLGNLLKETGRTREGEAWLRRAAELGNEEAMYEAGLSSKRAGRVEEAEVWFRRAADQGHVHAMTCLGLSLEKAGRVVEAEDRYREAAEGGDPDAMSNLGSLLEGTGRVEEAEAWFRRAVEQGHSWSMVALSSLLRNMGRTREADVWSRRVFDENAERVRSMLEETRREKEGEGRHRRG
ncbi:tetratricopeptide repeat protein [Nocardiopsis alba]|uniref:tetratricopeptide repeat protein n=1 Tax=Nocardiopsis alba TaxID=53437 RepID=UPI0033F656EE